MTGYSFHPEALLDLDEVWEFIAEDSTEAADKVIATILSSIATAASLPYQGHLRPDLTSHPLRFLHVYDYLIVYAVDEKPIWIVAILHGRRSPNVMAAVLRTRQ